MRTREAPPWVARSVKLRGAQHDSHKLGIAPSCSTQEDREPSVLAPTLRLHTIYPAPAAAAA
jgi:hypothetical protein